MPKMMPVAADRHEKRKDGRVHRELDPIGLADIGDGEIEQANTHEREKPAQHAAEGREHDADQKLTNDRPLALRAIRTAISLERRADREEKICDVGAGDEQHS